MKSSALSFRSTVCLYAAVFVYFLSENMYGPFFSMYVTELGGSYGEFALVLSVTGFVLSAIQSYIGYLSDRMGPGRLVLLGGGISAAGMLLTGVLYDRRFVLPLYLLMSVGMGILVPSVFSLVSRRKTADGGSFIPAYRSIQGAGVIAGPVVGGWLIGRSYRGNVFVSAALMLAASALFALCFAGERVGGEERTESDCEKVSFRTALRAVAGNRSFLTVMLLFAAVELSYDLIRLNLPIAGLALNVDTEVVGVALSAYFVAFTLFQIPINRKLNRMKKRSALLLMGSLSLLPCGALAAALPDGGLIAAMAGVGLTVGSLFTYCSVLASEESPEDQKGTYMGLFNTVMPCTDMISPLLTAGLAGLHVKAPYWAAVILILLFLLLSASLFRGRETSAGAV